MEERYAENIERLKELGYEGEVIEVKEGMNMLKEEKLWAGGTDLFVIKKEKQKESIHGKQIKLRITPLLACSCPP